MPLLNQNVQKKTKIPQFPVIQPKIIYMPFTQNWYNLSPVG